ncbi:hypothetical protein TPENAI_70248 [Tenacibaculum litopenaei]|uniref:hypothetical protein n=1 Tax=Tenacibaculum litopenaei TaxID=396016 RepID=UPI0038949F45
MKSLIQFLKKILRKKRYSSKEQLKNREKRTIIEIAKKVIEEEKKTKKINDRLDQKMSEFLTKKKAYLLSKQS